MRGVVLGLINWRRELSLFLSLTKHGMIEITEYLMNGFDAKNLRQAPNKLFWVKFLAILPFFRRTIRHPIRTNIWMWKKIGLLSALKLSLSEDSVILEHFKLDRRNFDVAGLCHTFALFIDADDFDHSADFLPIITYFAGYRAYAVNKKLKCAICETILRRREEYKQRINKQNDTRRIASPKQLCRGSHSTNVSCCGKTSDGSWFSDMYWSEKCGYFCIFQKLECFSKLGIRMCVFVVNLAQLLPNTLLSNMQSKEWWDRREKRDEETKAEPSDTRLCFVKFAKTSDPWLL